MSELALPAQTCRAGQDDGSLDPRAFHHTHAVMVRRIIASRVSGPEDVEDIRQKTWASFFKDGGLAADDPVAFLVCVARRRVVDHYRRAAARETCTGEEALSRRLDELFRDRLAHRLSHNVITKVDLERALAELSAKQRLLLELHFVDDLDPKTVARILGISRATFYKKCGEALDHLRTSPLLTFYQPLTDQEEGQ